MFFLLKIRIDQITILQLSSKFGDADFKIKFEVVSGHDGKPIVGIEEWIRYVQNNEKKDVL